MRLLCDVMWRAPWHAYTTQCKVNDTAGNRKVSVDFNFVEMESF